MLAVISDIHGNLTALEAVLKDIEASNISNIICLGDVADFGPMPAECLARVRDLACPVIMGNTDDYLLNPRKNTELARLGERGEILLEVERWCAAQLSEQDKHFISSFSERLSQPVGEIPALFFHASPRNYDDIIRVDTPEDDIRRYCDGYDATLMLGGHTHQQFLRRIDDWFFINPGSVGAAFQKLPGKQEIRPSWAEYAVLSERKGQPSITFRRVLYELEALLEAAAAMPHGDFFVNQWVQK
jgi:predicted phosphodiesterase